MKTLIWKIKYALRIRAIAKASFSLGWYMAGVAVECQDDYLDWHAEDMADEEMSYWSE
jgi:hypothetical protein